MNTQSLDSAELFALANRLRLEGKLDEAEAHYRNALSIRPDYAEAHNNLGAVHQAQGRFDEAADSYRAALAADPAHPDAHYNLANVLAYQGRHEEAVTHYRNSIARRPEFAEAYDSLGTALHALGRFEDAAAEFRRALDLQPAHATARTNLAASLISLGRLDDSIACLREAVSLHPNDYGTRLNLGAVLRAKGQLDDAAEAYRQAIVLDPRETAAYANLGAMWQAEGRMDDAIEFHCKVIALDPENAAAHFNIGWLRHQQDRLDEAVGWYRKLLSFRPDDSDVHNNLGVALRDLGRLDESIEHYRAALAGHANRADTHFNLGSALRDKGELEDAIAAYRAAIAIAPDNAEAHHQLANTLTDSGAIDAAVAAYRRALELDEQPAFKADFVRCIKSRSFDKVEAGFRELVVRAIREPWEWLSELTPLALRLIRSDRDIDQCVERAVKSWPQRLRGEELFGPSGLAKLANDALLRAVLEGGPICDPTFERFLTLARFAMQDAVVDARGTEPGGETLGFYCALARHCFINEYIFSVDDAELDRAARLRKRVAEAIREGGAVAGPWLAAIAAYGPLSSIAGAAALLERSWPAPVAGVLTQQIAEPQEERGYRAGVPRLTPIEDRVSTSVQEQYEQHPFPRWIRFPASSTFSSLDRYLRRLLPSASFRPLGKGGNLDILIAGCGTGLESNATAQTFPESRVLAIDLSLSSLCYAKRKTLELGLTNLEYAQADLTRLGSLDRSFDFISSVGVLHHLADPKAGLQVLESRLRPGGFLRLGFYSEFARKSVVAARELIAEKGYGVSEADIRRCRVDLMQWKKDDRFDRIFKFRDFYVMSEIRDLLFHVQEQRFYLSTLRKIVEDLGLQFLGFSISDPVVLAEYARRFPDDRQKTNLDYWNYFEIEFPDTFREMYQFWLQKPV